MIRTFIYDRNDLTSVLSALETVSAFYADDKAAWERERRALQKAASVHVQLRDARERIRLLERVVHDVDAWHAQLYKHGGGYHTALHDILLRAKKTDEEPSP